MRILVRAAVAAILVLATAATVTPPAAAAGHRLRRESLSKVRAHVVPKGGVKAGAMAGGNTIGGWLLEDQPRADGYRHVDTPAMIRRLKAMNANTYLFGIWESPTDWDDLRLEFAPAAQRAGLRIWVYIVPPTECVENPDPLKAGRCSRPYTTDYIAWAGAIASLSRQYSNVVAWAIDDFSFQDPKKFTPEYMQKIVDTQDAINPELGFYTTAYLNRATDPAFVAKFAPYIDGLIYPYTGTSGQTMDASEVGPNLDKIRAVTEPYGLDTFLLVYTHRFLDAIGTPTEHYVYRAIEAGVPYANDGRIGGVIAYGAPMTNDPALTADNQAMYGNGRLAFRLGWGVAENAGAYAQATQEIPINPVASRYTLSFGDYYQHVHTDSAAGYQFLQVLVNDELAWQSDIQDLGRITDDGEVTWKRETVDLTRFLRGRAEAKLTLRLYVAKRIGDYPLDIGVDDIHTDGFWVLEPGFEHRETGLWKLSANNHGLLPMIDTYAKDRPARVRAAVGAAFADLTDPTYPEDSTNRPERSTGTAEVAAESTAHRPYRTDNAAMYGNGRLDLSVANHHITKAGDCAQASQVVHPDPASPRYQFSFWRYGPYGGPNSLQGFHHQRVLIDGRVVWENDSVYRWSWWWLNGDLLQGNIDVTTLLKGRTSATVTFQLCEQKSASFPVTVRFDNIQTIGFTVANPGFETSGGWRLESNSPSMAARIVTAGPPADAQP